MSQTFEHITILGTGNAAKVLSKYFKLKKYPVKLVVGRNEEKLKQIALENNINFQILNENKIATDLLLICVSDFAIQQVISQIKTNSCVVHISGTTDITTLDKFNQHAVFYPLQTMSPFSEIENLKIPFLLDSNDSILIKKFRDTFNQENIILSNSEERKKHHLAAVMVNNFCNFVLVSAQDYCQKNNLNFETLKPLLSETLFQNLKHQALNLQTGPAKRKDENTINKHLDMLINDPNLSEFYKMMSGFIEERFG